MFKKHNCVSFSYLGLGIMIDFHNYRLLFMDQKAFKKRYGIGNEEILKMYEYNLDLDDIKIKNMVM